MSENKLYKKVFVQTSSTGVPQQVLAGEDDNVKTVLEIAEVNPDKSQPTVDGNPVELTFKPAPGSTIVLEPKKYSSGNSLEESDSD